MILVNYYFFNYIFMKDFFLICISSVIISGIGVFFNVIDKKAWLVMSIGFVIVHYIGKWYEAKFKKDKK